MLEEVSAQQLRNVFIPVFPFDRVHSPKQNTKSAVTAPKPVPFPFLTLIFPQEKYLLKCYNVWAWTLLFRYLNSFDFLFIHQIQQSSFNLHLNGRLLFFGLIVIIVITECFPDVNIISCLLLFYYIVGMRTRISIHGWIDSMIPFIPAFVFNDRSPERTFIYLARFIYLLSVKLTFHSSHLNFRCCVLSRIQNDMFFEGLHLLWGSPREDVCLVDQLQAPELPHRHGDASE